MKTSHYLTLSLAALLSFAPISRAASSQSSSSGSQSSSSGSSMSSGGSSSSHSTSGSVSREDRNFILKAAESGMKEVAISSAVLDKLTNPEVKQFAQMMVSDHTTANTELMTLASGKGVTLPTEDKAVGGKANKWDKKSKNVDADYVKQMVSDHQDAVKNFQDGTKSKDPEIAAFASKTLPTLQHHLDMVNGLKTSLK